MKFFIFSLLFFSLAGLGFSVVQAKPTTTQDQEKKMTRQEMIRVLQTVTQWSKEWNPWTVHRDYYNNVFLPTLVGVSSLLKQGADMELCTEFLKVVVGVDEPGGGYEDDRVADVLADIFFTNPRLIEDAYRQFSVTDQKTIYCSLEFAWGSIPSSYADKTDPKVIRATKRLRVLNPSSTSCP